MARTAAENIDTAYEIVADPRCTAQAVRTLQRGFAPLTDNEAATRTTMVSEYLLLRELVQRDYSLQVVLGGVRGRNLARPILFNRNRTIRSLRGLCDPLIQRADDDWPTPSELRQALKRAGIHRRPGALKNVGGRCMLRWFLPGYGAVFTSSRRARVKSDLLALVLCRQLGQPAARRDASRGAAYVFDEAEGIARDIGPDGKAGTADDITLGFGR
jgi:hypothetical protein